MTPAAVLKTSLLGLVAKQHKEQEATRHKQHTPHIHDAGDHRAAHQQGPPSKHLGQLKQR
jgi:hypothetical protein